MFQPIPYDEYLALVSRIRQANGIVGDNDQAA
jgi:hypothetical protein